MEPRNVLRALLVLVVVGLTLWWIFPVGSPVDDTERAPEERHEDTTVVQGATADLPAVIDAVEESADVLKEESEEPRGEWPTLESPKELDNGWQVARGALPRDDAPPSRLRVFDDTRLAELGFSSRAIDRIYGGWELAMMERGPVRLQGDQTSLSKNISPMRDEMGDSDYDAALYAAGIGNRVQVKNVVEGSKAYFSGLRNGDTIVSYAGERIFGLNELSHVIVSGEAGQMVRATIVRDDKLEDIDIPLGWAIGFSLEEVSEPPL